jgi:hypothetical protein
MNKVPFAVTNLQQEEEESNTLREVENTTPARHSTANTMDAYLNHADVEK